MNRDIKSNVLAAESLRPAIHAATVNGQEVDLRGADSAMVIAAIGAIAGSGVFALSLQETDTSGSGYTTVAAADLQGSFAAIALTNTVEEVGYLGNKRYVRAVFTKTSGTSVAASAVILKGNLHRKPDGQTFAS